AAVAAGDREPRRAPAPVVPRLAEIARKQPTAANPLRGDWKPIDYGPSVFFPAEIWSVGPEQIVVTARANRRTFSYKLDPTAIPPAIDLTALDGPDKGKTYPGIFSRDGDYLEVCYDDRAGAKRPKAFVTTSEFGGS